MICNHFEATTGGWFFTVKELQDQFGESFYMGQKVDRKVD
jgi:hypothetical protein